MCGLFCVLLLVIGSGSVVIIFNIKPGLQKGNPNTLLETFAVELWVEEGTFGNPKTVRNSTLSALGSHKCSSFHKWFSTLKQAWLCSAFSTYLSIFCKYLQLNNGWIFKQQSYDSLKWLPINVEFVLIIWMGHLFPLFQSRFVLGVYGFCKPVNQIYK